MERSIGLNLARAWRPRALRDVVGQRVTVSLLENSLRRGLFFPVYLFAGLRGTGKTSVGRIFATALNCEKLTHAQRGEDVVVPCHDCPSCRSMAAGSHPDFIEIDAASHTGVDQARQIIEEAAFLPVLGSRKVYLIDEAHMLSKASFNAFLKMLEEPPASVVFLLATTDPHKIIETVRSRCFQLFFDPVKPNDLVPHLEKVCSAEQIAYDREALTLVALESDGSIRDALNLIERLRCATEKITSEAFFSILGCPDDQGFITLFEIISSGDAHALFAAIRERDLAKFEPTIVWKRLVELVRALLWAHENVPFGLFQAHFADVRRVALKFSFTQLIEFLDLLFRFEGQFGKTTARHALIERFLYACLQRCTTEQPEGPAPQPASRPTRAATPQPPKVDLPIRRPAPEIREQPVVRAQPAQPNAPASQLGDTSGGSLQDTSWKQVLARLGNGGDPMLTSVLRQGEFVSFDNGVVRVRFPKKFVFYQELLINNRNVWQPHLEQVLGAGAMLVPDFSGEQVSEPRASTNGSAPTITRVSGPKPEVDVTDGEKWPLAKTLLEVFPGKITVTEDTPHERNS